MSTLTSFLNEVARKDQNAINILQGLSDLYKSSDSNVTIEYRTADGQEVSFQVQSYGFLISEIQRISQNQTEISDNISLSKARIKLPDGRYRLLYSENAAYVPTVIDSPKITEFDIENNPIIEKLLSPLPYAIISVNDINIKKVQIKKYKMLLDDPNKVSIFESNLSGNLVSESDFLSLVGSSGIKYSYTESVYDITPFVPESIGTFDVLDVYKKEISVLRDDVSYDITRMVYKLNKLDYINRSSGLSTQLQVGSHLIYKNDESSSKFIIDFIDSSTNEIAVTRVFGSDIISISSGNLAIDPNISSSYVKLPIRPDEYIGIFIKTISDDMITSDQYGMGQFIYSGSLSRMSDGTPLRSYDNIINISYNIDFITQDKIIPLSKAIIPDAPVLDESLFQISILNNHKQIITFVDQLREKYAQKSALRSEIDAIDSGIVQLKARLLGPVPQEERNNIIDSISSKNNEKSLKVAEYKSVVDEILSGLTDISRYKIKYSLSGFIPIPEPKYEDPINMVGPQHVIGFRRQYRYITKDGKPISGTTIDGQLQGIVSKWTELPISVRRRSIVNGIPVWLDESLMDGDIVNFNQLQIPITEDEGVEIRVKALSEAGFPIFPSESSWSNTIKYIFPDELKSDVETIFSNANADKIRLSLMNELSTIGLYDHLNNSFRLDDLIYDHIDSKILSSSFRTPENKPLSVDQVLQKHDNDIRLISDTILNRKGQMQVRLLDAAGGLISNINNNDTILVNSGFYANEVDGLAVKKGAIIQKSYVLEISNLAASDLELLSYVPGLSTIPMPDSTYTGYIHNPIEFQNYRRYWEVPISLSSILVDDFLRQHYQSNINPFINIGSFGSSQVRGQFISFRKKDITLGGTESDLYKFGNSLLPIFSGSTPRPWIWNGSPSNSGNGNESAFCIHIDHPDIQTGSEFLSQYNQMFSLSTLLPSSTADSNGNIRYPQFIHSEFFNLPDTHPDGKKQLAYRFYNKQNTSPSQINFPQKIGFYPNDRFLIGSNTVGAYLFPFIPLHRDISTGRIAYNEGFIVKSGNTFTIKIPIIFQCRMTDYYGSGSEGIGIIGGFGSPITNNITYVKKLGIDLLPSGSGTFSFDLEFKMSYRRDTRDVARPTSNQ